MTNDPTGTGGEAMPAGKVIDLDVWRSARPTNTDRHGGNLPRLMRCGKHELSELRMFWRLVRDGRHAIRSGDAEGAQEAIDELEVFEMHCRHHGLRQRVRTLLLASSAQQTTA